MELIQRGSLSVPRSGRELSCTIALSMSILVTWALTHHYSGLARDGSLYAIQAFAQIHPALYHDLSLMNNSQDRYTLFSPIYGFFIGQLGLPGAEMLLYVICLSWFLTASWSVARNITSRIGAWAALGMLVITAGFYGAYEIFDYSETYLTARSLAEALVATALAVHFAGRRYAAFAVAIGAMLVHPLMALPGVLLLIFLAIKFRYSVIVSVIGVASAALLAVLGANYPSGGALRVIDPDWLEVVRERSQFLFLSNWSLNDWELHVRVFLCLGLSAMVIGNVRVSKLCSCATLLGVSGLAVAYVAGSTVPVSILLQGQAWRWFWVSKFVCVLLLGASAITMSKDNKCGLASATLLVSGWTFAPIYGAAAVALSMILWRARSRIDARAAYYLRWAAYGLMLIIGIWTLSNIWSAATSHRLDTREQSVILDSLRSILGLQIPAVLCLIFVWFLLTKVRWVWFSSLIAMLLGFAAYEILPGTFDQILDFGSRSQIDEFADWRAEIPEAASVLMIGPRKAAAFIWFTLQRPAYLSVDQSSGVVFSRATALEVKRRSEILLPIEDPDWKIFSILQQKTGGRSDSRPLTAQGLATICRDSALNFVAAPENVGFAPIRHEHTGRFQNWNLYDCRRVRSAQPSA